MNIHWDTCGSLKLKLDPCLIQRRHAGHWWVRNHQQMVIWSWFTIEKKKKRESIVIDTVYYYIGGWLSRGGGSPQLKLNIKWWCGVDAPKHRSFRTDLFQFRFHHSPCCMRSSPSPPWNEREEQLSSSRRPPCAHRAASFSLLVRSYDEYTAYCTTFFCFVLFCFTFPYFHHHTAWWGFTKVPRYVFLSGCLLTRLSRVVP